MRWFRWSEPGFQREFEAFLQEQRGGGASVREAVEVILAKIRTEGAAGLLELARKFDGVELTEGALRVSPAEVEEGLTECPEPVRDAIRFAATRIRAYHERQRPSDQSWIDDQGVSLGWRWGPLDSVGIYVPGGRAAYPSTVLMNAIPARVAGVARIAMVSPPGRIEPAVLAAAAEAGVTEIWRVGGAQAVAALAFGAGPILPVDKIVGPGNAYVTEAKRQVYGTVGIDALAGPSEIVVVSDERSNPAWIAADLLSQAEHDPDAQSILITDSADFAEAVAVEIERNLGKLASAEVARASIERHGAVVIAPLSEAHHIVNQIAPEHVELCVDDPQTMASGIRHAGAIFLGRRTPEAIGDYVGGSNHVLPTSRAARFSSGLSLYDFLKRTSLLDCSVEGFAALAPRTVVLAEAEGLPAHALSAALRLGEGRE